MSPEFARQLQSLSAVADKVYGFWVQSVENQGLAFSFYRVQGSIYLGPKVVLWNPLWALRAP